MSVALQPTGCHVKYVNFGLEVEVLHDFPALHGNIKAVGPHDCYDYRVFFTGAPCHTDLIFFSCVYLQRYSYRDLRLV